MKQAILLKEWLKTRNLFWVALIVALAFAVYAIMNIQRIAVNKGVDHIWLIMLMKDQIFVDVLKYVPLVIGIALGSAQMLPEMSHKRLKLTLHLPYPHTKMVLLMLAIGLGELGIIYLLQALAIGVFYSKIIVSALVWRVLLSLVPWYLAGLSAYLFTAAVCLEGTYLRRIILALIGVVVVWFYYEQSAPEAYNAVLPGAILFTCLLILLPFNSVSRFKEGRQD